MLKLKTDVPRAASVRPQNRPLHTRPSVASRSHQAYNITPSRLATRANSVSPLKIIGFTHWQDVKPNLRREECAVRRLRQIAVVSHDQQQIHIAVVADIPSSATAKEDHALRTAGRCGSSASMVMICPLYAVYRC